MSVTPLSVLKLLDYPFCVHLYGIIDFVFKGAVGHNFNENDAFMSLKIVLTNSADPDEMAPFMGFVWVFIVCQSTCYSVSRMKNM